MLSLAQDAAYYNFPPPKGSDFDDMTAATRSMYISAGIGPRMLFDSSARITLKDVNEIFDVCWKVPDLVDHVMLLDQMSQALPNSYIEPEYVSDLASLTKDKTLLDSVEQYGEAFRLMYMSLEQASQVLGLPFNITASEDMLDSIRHGVVKRLIVDKKSGDKGISIKLLEESARTITSNYIKSQLAAIEMAGMPYTVYSNVPDNRVYSCVDVFIYFAVVDGSCKVYITTSDSLPDIAAGIGPDVDDAIAESADDRWNYIASNDLIFPPIDVGAAMESIMHPPREMIDVLNGDVN